MHVIALDLPWEICSSWTPHACMSQPKHQLHTFSAWAGKSSDVSYYLNSHHVNFSEWVLAGISRPKRVTAMASIGVAKACGIDTEDSITLTLTNTMV